MSDERSWIGIGSFMLACAVLAIILFDKALLDNDAFLVLATAIIITGWVGGPVAWAYSATKQGGELADKNAAIVHESATASTVAATTLAAATAAALPVPGEPTEVKVVNPPEDPANVTEAHAEPASDPRMPDYAV